MTNDIKGLGEELKKILSPELGQLSAMAWHETIDNLKLQITLYLQQARAIQARGKQALSLERLSSSWEETNKNRYAVIKNIIAADDQAEGIVKNGYILVDTLREAFTGEPIMYQIGVVLRGKLYEGKVPLNRLLEYVTLQAQWKQSENTLMKLRLTASKGQMQRELGLLEANKESQILYSKVKSSSNKYGTKNEGNIYETYAVQKRTARKRLSQKAYEDVRRNTESFVKGGDWGSEQFKTYGASLASLNTIISILENFNKILIMTHNIENIKTGLSALFEKEPNFTNIANDFEGYTQEEFEKLLATLQKQ